MGRLKAVPYDNPIVLGIDLGTSSVKVVLTDRLGGVLAQSRHDYEVHRPEPGWAESEPDAWWSAVVAAVADVIERVPHPPPAGIGLSGQMHGVVLVDDAGRPVRPAILWEDARAERELDRYRSLDTDVSARLANPLSPGMAGPILAWLTGNAADAIARSSVAVQPKDWVRGRLTGRWAGEPSDASATLLYNVLTQEWDHDVANALGIPIRLLPPLLRHSGAGAGHLLPEAAAALGLPAGIPVAAGAGDSAAAALGAGLPVSGAFPVPPGTGVQLVSAAPAPNATSRTRAEDTVTHRYRAATRHGWYAMAAGLTGGATLSWVRQLFAVDWAQLYDAAARKPRLDDPIFLPHLIGERTPYLDTAMRGAWTRLDARHDRQALLYSALEGVAFAVADGLEALPGIPAGRRSLRLDGGSTEHPAWRNLLANVLNAELHAVATQGASARGAALLAAVAAGLLGDDELRAATAAPASLVAEPEPDPVLEERRHSYHRALQSQRTLGRAERSDPA